MVAGALISAISSGVTWRPLEIRGSSSSRVAASRHGHHSRLGDVAAADKTGEGGLLAASL